ncbi:four helix bundle protein [Patescibacteria group bacterium]|nr:four helix bundle protein [Patescibacteria group bacterium]
MKTFRDIVAWQKSYQLVLAIYKYTANFPRSEEFGLKSQLRRAAVSIISNIAEGFKRKGKKDSLRFYNQSQASLEEVKCQLMLSFDLGYLDEKKYSSLDQMSDEAGKVLHGWAISQ